VQPSACCCALGPSVSWAELVCRWQQLLQSVGATRNISRAAGVHQSNVPRLRHAQQASKGSAGKRALQINVLSLLLLYMLMRRCGSDARCACSI
jgi:hypothetical protein